MSGVEEIGEDISRSLSSIRSSYAAVVQAEDEQLQALGLLSNAVQGTANTEMLKSLAAHQETSTRFQAIYGHLGRVVTVYETYLDGILHRAAPAQRKEAGQLNNFGVLLASDKHQKFPTELYKGSKPTATGLFLEIEGGTIIGDVASALSASESANIDHVGVQQGKREGKGSYLVSAFAREVRLRGARALTSFVINEPSMRTHMRSFGTENLDVTHDDTLGARAGETVPAATSPQYAEWLLAHSNEGIEVRVDPTDPKVHDRLFGA
jgi:hypothetical protein